MANVMGKIEEKLHMGGHQKQEDKDKEEGRLHTAAAQGQGGAYPGEDVGHHGPGGGPCAPMGGVQTHEGPLDKIKHKLKGRKGEGSSAAGGGGSSSSSESDGEGGRRKKNRAPKNVAVPVAPILI